MCSWVTPGPQTRSVQPACPAGSHSTAVPRRSLLDYLTWPTRLTAPQGSRVRRSWRSSRTERESWPPLACLSARPSGGDLSGVRGAGRAPAGRAPWWTRRTPPWCERHSPRLRPLSSTRASRWWWAAGPPRREGTGASSCRGATVWGFPLVAQGSEQWSSIRGRERWKNVFVHESAGQRRGRLDLFFLWTDFTSTFTASINLLWSFSRLFALSIFLPVSSPSLLRTR